MYGDHIIRESAIVAQFLADLVPATHLTPRTGHPEGALMRERIAFFVETYFSKANKYYYSTIAANTDEEADKLAEQYVDAIINEVEPLLQDASPFFGGSSKLTMAEVCWYNPLQSRVAVYQNIRFLFKFPVHEVIWITEITLQVLAASFIIRIFTLPDVENAPLPRTMLAGLETMAPKFYCWAQAVIEHPSVNGIYDRDGCANEMRDRRAKARALALGR